MEPTRGQLRDNVRIERRPDGTTASGGVLPFAVLVAERRVSLQPVRGGEDVQAARAQGVSSWDLWVPWDSEVADVRAQDRVVDNRDPTRVFNIRFAEDLVRRRRWIVMQLELGGASG